MLMVTGFNSNFLNDDDLFEQQDCDLLIERKMLMYLICISIIEKHYKHCDNTFSIHNFYNYTLINSSNH